jgi:rare lipoprotein A
MKIFAPTALGAAVLFGVFAIPAHALSGGVASFYGPGFAGKKTANGERFNPGALTAAHRSLPFGTRLKLTNTANGRSVVVRINDRGPFVGGRVLDVSQGAASALGFVAAGTARLKIEPVSGRAATQAPTPRATSERENKAAAPEQHAEREEAGTDWTTRRMEEQMSGS